MYPQPRFLEITPKTWKEVKLIGDFISDYYIFRGHADSGWALETTLLRTANLKQDQQTNIRMRESRILKKFKSRAFQYIQSPPNDNENIEWLSLIQDHGGPSRLLDFSESFYVASFFALDSIRDTGGCIWAIENNRMINALLPTRENSEDNLISKLKPSNKTYHGDPELVLGYAESILADETINEDFVLRVLPPRLNERLAVQKGLFLFPCNLNKSFEYNLCRTLKFPFDSLESKNAIHLNYDEYLAETNRLSQQAKQATGVGYFHELVPVLKIDLSKDFVKDGLHELHKINIDYASLFPGLDGFAKSLHRDFASPSSIPITFSGAGKRQDVSASDDDKT